MTPAVELVILLAVGSFQAAAPGTLREPSAVYPDTAEGARDFVVWLRGALPPPRFAQPPMQVCVVGAVPFSPEAAPLLPKPLWESRHPWRALEPYAATFHYVEPPAPGGKPGAVPKPRTLRDAVKLCAAKRAESAKAVAQAASARLAPPRPAPKPAPKPASAAAPR
jgi:hypothetical protein